MDYDAPCINCRRFHYGRCFSDVRQCWSCRELGHIQRYCRERKKANAPYGEHLPGSRAWCRALSLDEDPQLRSNIQTTLKEFPGATIYLNDECIYRGVQIYFYRKALPKGPELAKRMNRSLASRITRRRSRSPSPLRAYKRSRSPLGRYSRSPSPMEVSGDRYDYPRHLSIRSPSPIRRPGDRYAYSRSLSSSSVEIISVREINTPAVPKPNQKRSQPPISNMRASEQRTTAPPPYMKFEVASASRPALGDRTNILSQPMAKTAPKELPIREKLGESVLVEDPHFVLGIRKGAPDAECVLCVPSMFLPLQILISLQGKCCL